MGLCPKCQARIEVPEPEDGPRLLDIAGEPGAASQSVSSAPTARPRAETSSTDIWQSPDASELPSAVQSALERAEVLGDTDQQLEALARLLAAGRNRLLTAANRPLWRPSVVCLIRWAQGMLDWIEEKEVVLSAPLKRLLKRAAENQRWGGTFTFRQCALCEQPLGRLSGQVKVKTVVGDAYLCCASPKDDDFALVQLLDTVWQALWLARTLDPDNRDIPITVEALPSWHKSLVSPDTRSSWCRLLRNKGEVQRLDLSPEAIDRWLAERGMAADDFPMRVCLRLVVAKVQDAPP